MIECKIYIHLPLQECPDVEIARYSFDPGFQVGDVVNVYNLQWDLITETESWLQVDRGVSIPNFEAMVKIRKYLLDLNRKDIIMLDIGLEMADKEHLAKLAEIIQHNSKQGN
jgi:hypothetical protein